ncbi:uncharacterized protein BT62DRAFT_924625 [Guyanagaster necrorhizus]|uniref:Uncharacterized protein n=1 Tax=Guyanagaster necrorhizus TaxID=856835 RepID=A0A9P7VFH6_9AGAR|nr:uncharacterized protein BT62DRAFT_924625 [Guyanagaster necrorhizus MCA 3950]KAG7439617.1 hypothetical protein BT62DRAFT_924625 [Guyanagaster necrorhizus MCA 3950]
MHNLVCLLDSSIPSRLVNGPCRGTHRLPLEGLDILKSLRPLPKPVKKVERVEKRPSSTFAQSSNVPFDAHVLAPCRHPNSVALPYLCVTDEEDGFSLMSGFVGRVVLGWLDKVRADPDVLPADRFARRDACMSRESWPKAKLRRSNDFRGDQIPSMMTVGVPKNNGNKALGSSASFPAQNCSFTLADSQQHERWSPSKIAKATEPALFQFDIDLAYNIAWELQVRRPHRIERLLNLQNVEGKEHIRRMVGLPIMERLTTVRRAQKRSLVQIVRLAAKSSMQSSLSQATPIAAKTSVGSTSPQIEEEQEGLSALTLTVVMIMKLHAMDTIPRISDPIVAAANDVQKNFGHSDPLNGCLYKLGFPKRTQSRQDLLPAEYLHGLILGSG